MGCLYQLTFPNGKKYIGITMGKSMDRFREHVADARHGLERAVHRAIRKYGAAKVLVKTLAESTSWQALQSWERGLIKAMRTFGDGYNMTEGGDGALGYRHTKESLVKIGERHRGNAYRKGKTLSSESKMKMSLAKKGKVLSESHRSNIAKALMGNTYAKGCVRSNAFRARMVEVKRGKPKTEAKLGIVGVSVDTQTGKYRATITVNQKTIHLGRHETIEEAIAARKNGEAIYFRQEAQQ